MIAKIPTSQEINRLFSEFHTPAHIIEHSKIVSMVSEFLGKQIISAGVKINLPLLKAAALLHDLVRITDFKKFDPKKFTFKFTNSDFEFWKQLREKYKGKRHEILCAEILEERGYPEVAEIIKKHRFLQIEQGFETLEEKILYYADKRVEGNKIVPLKERLSIGRKRNAPETIGLEKTAEIDRHVFELEREICGLCSIAPENLTLKNLL